MSEKSIYYIVTLAIVIGVIIFGAVSGCALYRAGRDAIIGKPTEQVTPTLPKEMMWQTIKGLTPNWLAIPVIAMGGVVMWYGAFKLGMACVIFGSINLFMVLATSRFGFWMAVCGFIACIAALASAMVAKNKAVKELIFGAQKLKDYSIEQYKGNKSGINRLLAEGQTKSTKKIVAKIKTKAKLRGDM